MTTGNNEKNSIISNSSDFLFIYEAIQSNPNGDPDQENKPRMDYDTSTNIVTDVRIKRFIRDYLKQTGNHIFVDTEEQAKVSMETRLKNEINRLPFDNAMLESLFQNSPDNKTAFEAVVEDYKKKNKGNETLFGQQVEKPIGSFVDFLKDDQMNKALLTELVHNKYCDVRMFGSAFAVKSFTKAFTGPIQLSWGYSLNKVELMESSSIVTIMNDDNSTFGKDYRVYYSLIAFQGTINKNAAKYTNLSEADRALFRKALWEAIPFSPTRSKINQYPKLYVELEYNDGYSNGHFGDLRNYITVKPIDGLEDKQVRRLSDLQIATSALEELIHANKVDGKSIKDVHVNHSPDFPFNI